MKPQALADKSNQKGDGILFAPLLNKALFNSSVLLAFLLCAPAGRTETFRWVDSEGMVHYTDQLPPEEAKRPRAKLSAEAKVKELIEGQKTQEELEQLKRLKRLRAEQQRIIAEQRDSDMSLLRTYHSDEEMRIAH